MGKRAVVLIAGLVLLIAGLSSCGGGTPADDGTVGISGTIRLSTTGAPVFQVSLNLFGSDSGNIFTDFNGFYRFSNLRDGTYTIVPAKTGYTFLPPTLTVTISGASLTEQNFLAFIVPAADPATLMLESTGHPEQPQRPTDPAEASEPPSVPPAR